MTVTDELLAEIAQELNRCKFSDDDDGDESWPSISGEAVSALTAELLRLRAENAELERVVKDVRWRVADTTDQLQAYGHSGDRLYGLDEWSVPIRNLNIAIGMLEKSAQ